MNLSCIAETEFAEFCSLTKLKKWVLAFTTGGLSETQCLCGSVQKIQTVTGIIHVLLTFD